MSSNQALLNALDGVCYLADGDARILAVGEPSWTAALRRYGAVAWGEGRALGRNLFDAMQGAEVRATYQAIHETVLSGARSHVSFELRCDAPDVRRTLRMSISAVRDAAGAAAVLYQSQILSAVARPWISLFDPQRIVDQVRSETGLPIVTVCSFCQRVAWPSREAGEWLEAEDYYRRGGGSDVRVSHGLCSDCKERLDPLQRLLPEACPGALSA